MAAPVVIVLLALAVACVDAQGSAYGVECERKNLNFTMCSDTGGSFTLEQDGEALFHIKYSQELHQRLVFVVCHSKCARVEISNTFSTVAYAQKDVDLEGRPLQSSTAKYTPSKGPDWNIATLWRATYEATNSGYTVMFRRYNDPLEEALILPHDGNGTPVRVVVSNEAFEPMPVVFYQNEIGNDLSLGSRQVIEARIADEHSSICFDVCDQEQCQRVIVTGFRKADDGTSRLEIKTKLAIPGVHPLLDYDDSFTDDLVGFRPGEVMLAIKRIMKKLFPGTPREQNIDTIQVSLLEQPSLYTEVTVQVGKMSTMNVWGIYRLKNMQFSIPTIPSLLSELNKTISSQPDRGVLNRTALETFYKRAAALAKDEEDLQVMRWLALAVKTLPLPADGTTFPLATNIVEYVEGARLNANFAKELQTDFVKQHLHERGTSSSNDLGRKINSTIDLLKDSILPSIKTMTSTLQDELEQLQDEIQESAKSITADQSKIKELEKSKMVYDVLNVVCSVFAFLGEALSVVPSPAEEVGLGMAFVSNIASTALGWLEGPIDTQIEKLQEEIKGNADYIAEFQDVVPLLDASLRLIRELRAAKGSSIDIRAWLSSPGIIQFKASLVLLSPKNVGAALSGMNLFELFTDVGHNIIDAMDKVEDYTAQRTIVDLVTPQLDAVVDPSKYQEGLQRMRNIVTENTIISDYRSTSRSLQLYAFPFCSNLGSANAEKCMVGRAMDGLVKCAVGSYANILAVLRQHKSSIYEKERRAADFVVEQDRDNSFVTWSSAKYGSLIADVLAGKRVHVHADVLSQGHSNIFAVKFHVIGLQFWHADPAVRAEIEAALSKFSVSLTHMGSSYFKCDPSVVAFSHRVVNIEYSFRKNSKGESVDYNFEYKKLRDGNALLSPYAMWSIQLLPLESSNADFAALKKFGSLVDMALVGEGTYLKENVPCDDYCVWDFVVQKKEER